MSDDCCTTTIYQELDPVLTPAEGDFDLFLLPILFLIVAAILLVWAFRAPFQAKKKKTLVEAKTEIANGFADLRNNAGLFARPEFAQSLGEAEKRVTNALKDVTHIS